MKIKDLIELVKRKDDCEVYPPNGYPEFFDDQHHLPEDLNEFYTLCGGLGLFLNSDYPIYIVSPQEFVLANPIIAGELCPEDISSEWYIVANDKNGQYITIDLSPERLGRCYDSFWDRHGLVGDSPIIACTFSELLFSMINNGGGNTGTGYKMIFNHLAMHMMSK